MKKIYAWFPLFLLMFLTACSDQEKIGDQPFVAAFERTSYNYVDIPDAQEMVVVFSQPAEFNGTVTIEITAESAAYGVDFETLPGATSNFLTLPISAGQEQVSFTFRNLIFPFDSDDKVITFRIAAINYPEFSNIQGYTESVVSFGSSLGGVATPNLGGPNEGNQIYFDLSSDTATEVFRESWDLGFYGGSDFRVGLNASIYLAAKQLETTDIDGVTQASVSAYFNTVQIGTFDPENEAFIDAPSGHITGTAMAEISADDMLNKVYLLNLGYTVGTTTPVPGSVAIAGNPRGWKKIRILREGDGYKLQYANLNSTTHEEVSIPKNAAFNFTFFSFNTNQIVSVEPPKTNWDLNFTVFTNVIEGSGSYGYADFVLNNLKGGARAYKVATSAHSYADFTLSDADETQLQDDQRVIGADWRDVFTGTAATDRFYVLRDPEGNWYKIRMLGFLNGEGVRGYPKLEYALLR